MVELLDCRKRSLRCALTCGRNKRSDLAPTCCGDWIHHDIGALAQSLNHKSGLLFGVNVVLAADALK
jgi:hypothetical protein